MRCLLVYVPCCILPAVHDMRVFGCGTDRHQVKHKHKHQHQFVGCTARGVEEMQGDCYDHPKWCIFKLVQDTQGGKDP